ncbi:hypothetical protein V2J09_006318 [Rumex salicifolius]
MASLHPTWLLIFFLVVRLGGPTGAASFVAHQCSNQVIRSSGAASFFEKELLLVFSDLISAASRSELRHSSSAGLGDDDHIQASFHCWRDAPSQICKKCVELGTIAIQKRCKHHISAIVWHEQCTLQYASSQGILQELTTNIEINEEEPLPWTEWYNISCGTKLADDRAHFNQTMASLMSNLIDEATRSRLSASPQWLYATDEVMVTLLETLYGVVECSPNESYDNCRKCLIVGFDKLVDACGGSTVAQVLMPGCWLGYDLGPSTPDLRVNGWYLSESLLAASM